MGTSRVRWSKKRRHEIERRKAGREDSLSVLRVTKYVIWVYNAGVVYQVCVNQLIKAVYTFEHVTQSAIREAVYQCYVPRINLMDLRTLSRVACS